MNVNFVYRGVDKSKAFEYSVQEDFEKLSKINLDLQWSKVEVSKDGEEFRVTLVLSTLNTELLACSTDASVKSAYANAYEKLFGLVRKEKTKFNNKRRKKAQSKVDSHVDVEDDETCDGELETDY